MLQKLQADGTSTDNLTFVIISALSVKVELSTEDITTKLMYFGVDRVVAFQGQRTRVTKQIQSKHIPFAQGGHCMACRCNLAFKTLSSLDIISTIEDLLLVCYNYFASA